MVRDILLAVLSGGLLVLAFPPFDLAFVAWFGLVPLFIGLQGKRGRQAFIIGLLWGIAFFFGTVYWTAHSMTVYGGIPLPVGILVLLLLVLYLSGFPAIFGLGYARIPYRGWEILVIPSLWVTLEYIRSFLFTGFPWVNLAYSQHPFLSLIQVSDITGVYGLSFVIVAINLFLYRSFRFIQGFWWGERLPLKEGMLVGLLLIGVFTYGILRIDQMDKAMERGRPLKVGIVQGNIDQAIKWNPTYQEETIKVYSQLSHEIAHQGVGLIVWPETATPFYLQSDTKFGPLVRLIPKEAGAFLLTGSPAYEQRDKRVHYYNSAFLLSPTGETIGRYDKIHLVPFGEYVPLKRLLFFVHKLVEGVGDFVPGNGPSPLSLNEGSFGVLICFESIFPEITRAFTKEGADFLINITNDAWFGRTSAPYQHMSQAAFRAVEVRRFLVRAANTGISGIVDPVGRIRVKSGLFTRETIVDTIRLKDGPELTLYTRYGDVFAIGCGIVVIICGIIKLSRFKNPIA